MRVAALYDIHGNLPALEAVLKEIDDENIDRILVGGDVVPGPMARESLATLTSLPIPVDFIHGNGESDVIALGGGRMPSRVPEAVHEAMHWVIEELEPGQVAELERWPRTRELEIPDVGKVLFCHATPRNDNEIFTRATPEPVLRPIFDSSSAAVVICGHTHMPFDRRIGDLRVVNPGSVGMPFGDPGAYWARIGPGVELRRTSYDMEAAAERMRATGYPQIEDFVERSLLTPPKEEDMIALFEGSPLRVGADEEG